MKVVAFVKGARALACLSALVDEGTHELSLIVAQPSAGASWRAEIGNLAEAQKIEILEPEDPHEEEFLQRLRSEEADVFLLLGYGFIVSKVFFEIPRLMTINLHGGKLPEMRGSSPLNWALIRGAEHFGLSVIKVDGGVDTGDILLEREFPIGKEDTIKDLHQTANEAFPEMLLEVLAGLEAETLKPRAQEAGAGSYYPLRFPDDGFVVWDLFTAEEVFNRVRALTKPYPPAFTYLDGRKVQLLKAEESEIDYFGEPGRIYRKTPRGVLVCAKDKCLWITEAQFDDSGLDALVEMERYQLLPNARGMLQVMLESSANKNR